MTAFADTIGELRTRPARRASDYQRWLSAYRMAIVNAGVFFVLSVVFAAFDNLPVAAHLAVAIIFFLGSLYAFYRLASTGGSLAAITFYVVGTGVAFGFGTAYSTQVDGFVFWWLFGPDEQARNLPMINLLNSFSVLVVLCTSWFMAKVKDRSAGKFGRFGLGEVFQLLQMFRIPAILLTVVYFALFISTFPVAKDLLVRNAVSQLRMMPLLAILLSFSMWGRLTMTGKVFAVAIATAMIVFGLFEAGKAPVLYAILALIGGLYLGHYRRAAVVAVFITAVFYFSFLSAAVTQMRSHWQYHAANNTIAERANIVWDILAGNEGVSPYARTAAVDQLYRFLHAPYQSYLIDEWREGRRGDSLDHAWEALIPRVLWPDKPNITRFSSKLYGQIFLGGADGVSGQAPTYTAEALWNYGWLGVFGVSILLGLELGWFTRKWLNFTNGISSELGIVVFAVPVGIFAIVVETWVGASYVGGFITLVVLIKAADLLMPFMRWDSAAESATKFRMPESGSVRELGAPDR